jgi:hypothetical protein
MKADLIGQARSLRTYVSRGELHAGAAVLLDAASSRDVAWPFGPTTRRSANDGYCGRDLAAAPPSTPVAELSAHSRKSRQSRSPIHSSKRSGVQPRSSPAVDHRRRYRPEHVGHRVLVVSRPQSTLPDERGSHLSGSDESLALGPPPPCPPGKASSTVWSSRTCSPSSTPHSIDLGARSRKSGLGTGGVGSVRHPPQKRFAAGRPREPRGAARLHVGGGPLVSQHGFDVRTDLACTFRGLSPVPDRAITSP